MKNSQLKNFFSLLGFVCCFVFFGTQKAEACTVTVSSSLSWTSGANAGASVCVTSGATLTLGAGSYSWNSLTVTGSTVVANVSGATGVTLTLATTSSLDATSTFHSNAKGGAGGAASYGAGTSGCTGGAGFGASTKSGTGGSYGGRGGMTAASVPNTNVGAPCGSFTQPQHPGSGGGAGNTGGTGGAGGGLIKITQTAGTFTLNGTLSANGGNGLNGSTYGGGGGSGGGIWITVPTFTGSGNLQANGGNGGNTPSTSVSGGAGGGGGRIAIYYSTSNTFAGTISLAAGTAGTTGSAKAFGREAIEGSFFEQDSSTGDVTCTASSIFYATYDASVSPPTAIRDFTTGWCGWLVMNGAGNTITVSRNMTISAGGALFADGLGAAGGNAANAMGASGCTNGGGSNSAGPGGGGAHGGKGAPLVASSSAVTASGTACGSFTEPVTAGSGGGASTFSASAGIGWGGNGGGAIRLNVSGNLTISGSITANGIDGVDANYGSGGGAGGSIYITAQNISGNGSMFVRGGDGGNSVGTSYGAGTGGSGGRIAVYYSGTNTFSGSVSTLWGDNGESARYFSGDVDATDYSCYSRQTPAEAEDGTYIEQNSTTGDLTCSVSGGGRFDASATLIYSVRDLTINSGCAYSVFNGQGNTLSVSRNATIYGYLSASYEGGAGGFPPGGTGSGSGGGSGGSLTGQAGAGGSHGGRGGYPSGSSSLILQPGAVYGSATQPVTAGSGGGAMRLDNTDGLAWGGNGGGAIRLNVAGNFNLYGTIESEGGWGCNGGPAGIGAGGGSGGSIYVTANNIGGTGSIYARGGFGGDTAATTATGGAGGGGGRVALYYSNANNFLGGVYLNGYGAGGSPTFYDEKREEYGSYFEQNSFNGDVDCTALTSFNARYDAAANLLYSIRNFTVSKCNWNIVNGWPTTRAIRVSGNLSIPAGSSVRADGTGGSGGIPSGGSGGNGCGGGGTGNFYGGGGGAGAGGNGGKGGSSGYGGSHSIDRVVFGSCPGAGGGASGSDEQYGTGFGGDGGGVVQFDVTGSTTINGTVSANGTSGMSSDAGAGGGGGGQIYIQTATFSGNGVLQANGGDGNYANGISTSLGGGGGGGGGRIGIFFHSSTWSGSSTTTGGSGDTGNGASNDGVAGTAGFVAGFSAPTAIRFSQNPGHSSSPVPAGTVLSTQPQVVATDASGYRTSYTTSTTLQAYLPYYDECTGYYYCDCIETMAVTFAGVPVSTTQGKAAFSSFAIQTATPASGVCIKPIASGLTSNDCYGPLDVTTGPAAKVVFTTQPSATGSVNTNLTSQPIVKVQDAYSNTITGSSAAVTLAPFTNNTCGTSASGVLSGASATAASGVATFSGVKYNQNATLYLGASAAGLAPACSSVIVIGSGGASSGPFMIFRGF